MLPDKPNEITVKVSNEPSTWDTQIVIWQVGQPTSSILTQDAIVHTWDLWGKPEGAVGEFVGALYVALCNGATIDDVIAKYDAVPF